MKSVYTLIIGLLLIHVSFGQVTITEVFYPKYIQGSGTGNAADDRKVPFVCRLTISGLLPDETYRYFNRFNTDTTNPSTAGGEGTPIFVNPNGTFTRLNPTQSPSFGIPGRYGTFKADASGTYTGWFMTEVTSSLSYFAPGKILYFRLMLNNPKSPTSLLHKLNIASPVAVINFGNTPGTGTGVRSTAATGGVAKNFVFLWDNPNGAGRPEAGTIIESDGVANTSANGYAPFYASDVNDIDKTWGTIIPNNLANGIQKIGQYSLTNGSEVGYKISTNGNWPVVGGTRASTANTTGGLTNIIVLDGALARLDGANIKTDQTITFGSLPAKTYGDLPFDPAATTSAGLPVSYESDNTAVAGIVNGEVTITGAGRATITAKQPGDDFYNAAPLAPQPLSVDKAMLTVTGKDQQMLMGDPLPQLDLIYTGFKNGDDTRVLTQLPTASTKATPASQPGRYEIVPAGGSAANYDLQHVKGWLTIVNSKQPQKLDFAPLPAKTYGTPDFDPGAIAESGLPVKYASSDTTVADTLNGGTKIHIKKIGTATITARQSGNSGWEAAKDTSVTLTVNKATLTITADNKKRKEGQPNPALTVTYSGFVNKETNTVLTAQPVVGTVADINSQAGEYDITVTGATADNYIINPVKGKLIIEPLVVQTITFDELPAKKYGDADFTLKASSSAKLPVTFSSSNPAVASVRNNQVRIVGAGTTTITASQAGDTIYAAARENQTLIVQKARLTIKASDVTKNDGEPIPPLTVTYNGFVKNEDSTVLTTLPVATTMANTSSVPGTYPITVQGAVAANYFIALLSGNLIILPAQGAVQDNMLAYTSRPGQLQVNVYSVSGGKGMIQVFDLNGARLANVNVTLNKGYTTVQVPVGNVAPGIYNVRVAAAGVLLKSKVIIQ